METWELIARLVAGVVLVAMNAFFVMTEFALTRAPQLGEEAFQDDERLRIAWKMTEELEIYLTGCQLGISTTSVVLGVVAEPAFTVMLEPLLGWLPEGSQRATSTVIGVIFIQLVHKIWGEQAPTYLGVERPLAVARFAAPIHYAFTKATSPVIRAGDGIAKWTLRLFGVEVTRSWVEEEVADEPDVSPRERVRRALSGASMPEDRKEEVRLAVEIDRIAVAEVAVGRDEVTAVEVDGGLEALEEVLRGQVRSRVPLLVDGDLDRCVGFLYVPALMAELSALRSGERTLRELAAEPITFHADLPIAKAIDRFQDARQEIAIVEDGGSAVGIVTVTDCLEAIVGDLEDPYDTPLPA